MKSFVSFVSESSGGFEKLKRVLSVLSVSRLGVLKNAG